MIINRNQPRRALAVAAMLLLALSSACAGFRQPEIELENVSIGTLGLTGGSLMVNLRVTNPNPVGVRAEDLRYQLSLRAPGDTASSSRNANWIPVADGTYDEDVTIRANETRTVSIPVDFSYAELGPAFRSVLRSGRLDYRATGTVRVRAAGASRQVPFRKNGSVNVLGGR
ncbi:LEA type 2 family protein [Longimicrobium terrae]|uniref:LEA14-like dessication related protein n=1 Tax=Longimicrobium terrae TaxID=1639882 RepID=A0A841H458_9BACT|nr:LEA type 2 family protein [Longimicrobium terrae]MBB4638582.1 LEA14-like dessication related protein [Longimicrobium terrae]MBB6072780.1 LEA14-like dessication related protein [Longimicrobium terrae]NNC30601.1 LEA type 2 family protein [Longimicrobium terrae]